MTKQSRRGLLHKIELASLSLEHLKNRIIATRLMEERIKKTVNDHLGWKNAWEEAEADLRRREARL